MKCLITELSEKEIINLRDGARLGTATDFEIEAESGKLTAIIISRKGKLFGSGNTFDDIKIQWNEIQVVGDDTILVDIEHIRELKPHKQTNMLSGIFREG